MKIKSTSLSQTKKIAERFMKEILKSEKTRKEATLIIIKGELGAGKTSFVQGIAKGLKIKENILSPTFVIMNKFQFKSLLFDNFYHFDCYRIEKVEEMDNINFIEIISNPKNIIVIEWPERIKKILPKKKMVVEIKILSKKEREISFMGR